ISGKFAWASSMLMVDSMTASSAHTHPHAEAADSENSLTHPNVTGGLGLSDDFHRYVPGSWFFCAARDSLHVGQQVSELAVVDFAPVVKIEADPLVGIVAQLLVEGTEFGLLFHKSVPFLLQLFPVRGRTGSHDVICQLANMGADLSLERDHVLGSHT